MTSLVDYHAGRMVNGGWMAREYCTRSIKETLHQGIFSFEKEVKAERELASPPEMPSSEPLPPHHKPWEGDGRRQQQWYFI